MSCLLPAVSSDYASLWQKLLSMPQFMGAHLGSGWLPQGPIDHPIYFYLLPWSISRCHCTFTYSLGHSWTSLSLNVSRGRAEVLRRSQNLSWFSKELCPFWRLIAGQLKKGVINTTSCLILDLIALDFQCFSPTSLSGVLPSLAADSSHSCEKPNTIPLILRLRQGCESQSEPPCLGYTGFAENSSQFQSFFEWGLRQWILTEIQKYSI